MTPEQQAKLDATMQGVVTKAWERYGQMQDTMTALKLLHRPGTGDREGFCSECGNVVPCQTGKFIEPFL